MNLKDNLLPRTIGWSFVLTAALALSACDRKSDQTLPAASNAATDSAVLPAVVTDNGSEAPTDANSDYPRDDHEAMERHHRQAMDHDAMRAGGANQSAPAPDPAPTNSAMPMKDM